MGTDLVQARKIYQEQLCLKNQCTADFRVNEIQTEFVYVYLGSCRTISFVKHDIGVPWRYFPQNSKKEITLKSSNQMGRKELSLCHKLKFLNSYIFAAFDISSWDYLIYAFGLQRYRDQKIRVCGKSSFSLLPINNIHFEIYEESPRNT